MVKRKADEPENKALERWKQMNDARKPVGPEGPPEENAPAPEKEAAPPEEKKEKKPKRTDKNK